MKESKLGVIEDTLYVPMLGRIYASEHCKNILYDKKALELKNGMPKGLVENDTQTQYTYLASASRSANVDRYIKNFIERKKMESLYRLVVVWKQHITEMIMDVLYGIA